MITDLRNQPFRDATGTLVKMGDVLVGETGSLYTALRVKDGFLVLEPEYHSRLLPVSARTLGMSSLQVVWPINSS